MDFKKAIMKNAGKEFPKVSTKKIEKTVKRKPVLNPDTTKEIKSTPKRKAEEMEVDNSTNEQVPEAPVFPADKSRKFRHHETRSVTIPQHRLNPLKTNWTKISEPLVQYLQLDVRFNIKTKQVQLRTSDKTDDVSNIQKAADFIQAFVYGFEVEDCISLIRLQDLYLETFDIKDVKLSLSGDHVGRAIGRLAGKGGKTRYTLENATKTRVILADSRVHILGAYQNIAAVRRAISNLIMGSPPSKVFGNLKSYADKLCQRS